MSIWPKNQKRIKWGGRKEKEMRGEDGDGGETKLQMNKFGAGALKEITQENFDRQK